MVGGAWVGWYILSKNNLQGVIVDCALLDCSDCVKQELVRTGKNIDLAWDLKGLISPRKRSTHQSLLF